MYVRECKKYAQPHNRPIAMKEHRSACWPRLDDHCRTSEIEGPRRLVSGRSDLGQVMSYLRPIRITSWLSILSTRSHTSYVVIAGQEKKAIMQTQDPQHCMVTQLDDRAGFKLSRNQRHVGVN